MAISTFPTQSLLRRFRRGTGTFSDDPTFARAERTLRTQFGAQRRKLEHQLRRGGVSAADIPRLTTGLRLAQQRGSRGLVERQQDVLEERRKARRARRRGRLGRILGFATALPFRIAGLNIARQAARNGGATTRQPSLLGNIPGWEDTQRRIRRYGIDIPETLR